MEDDLDQLRQAVKARGVERYGKSFTDCFDAVGLLVGQIPTDTVRAVLNNPDIVDQIPHAGIDALGQLASNGDKEAERKLARIRTQQRREHALARGRRWID